VIFDELSCRLTVHLLVPTFDDDESLPVLRAFILESMRWRPLVPMGEQTYFFNMNPIRRLVSEGLPHRATEDIIWVWASPRLYD
jgi:hypothetical protein